jgi:HAMP domain-containing protein
MKSLAARMAVLALGQLVLLGATWLVIFWLTAPSHHHHHGPPPMGPMVGPPPPHDGNPTLGISLTFVICGAILVVGSILTARWIVRPIEKLSDTARAIAEGDLAARSGLDRDDEIGALARRVDDMAAQIEAMLANER